MSKKKLHYGARLMADQQKHFEKVPKSSEWIRKAKTRRKRNGISNRTILLLAATRGTSLV